MTSSACLFRFIRQVNIYLRGFIRRHLRVDICFTFTGRLCSGRTRISAARGLRPCHHCITRARTLTLAFLASFRAPLRAGILPRLFRVCMPLPCSRRAFVAGASFGCVCIWADCLLVCMYEQADGLWVRHAHGAERTRLFLHRTHLYCVCTRAARRCLRHRRASFHCILASARVFTRRALCARA